jgi:hypothetical protein
VRGIQRAGRKVVIMQVSQYGRDQKTNFDEQIVLEEIDPEEQIFET